uniref:Uncharacterized protein n=1 Tax=Leersia perrieri TaxID=77586 RepID=A0A0D9VW39_9ORYZ
MDMDDMFGGLRVAGVPMKSAIYVWGYNHSGQTARKGKECHLRIPKSLPPKLFKWQDGKNLRWIDVACGREHTAAVASDGSLYTWGANDFGQLGDGTEESAKEPQKVKALETEFVKSVSCGGHCTAAVAEPRENDDTISRSRLWVWGQNQGSDYPRLFWGAFAPNTVSCGAVHVMALSEDGLLQAWDILGDWEAWDSLGIALFNKELIPRRVVALDQTVIRDVSCGGVHSCAVTEDGALYAWGGGHVGQLGLGPQSGFFSCALNGSDMLLRNIPVLVIPSGVKFVTCGHSHTLVSMKDGCIYGWGYNSYGQAANAKSTYAWFPSPVDWCVGEVRRLAAGGGHSAVLTDACSLKELCEFKLAETVNMSNALLIEDIASRTGGDALARLCEKLREHLVEQGECEPLENQMIEEVEAKA